MQQNISTPLAILLSIAAGLAIGNLYWAQPLLSVIAYDFKTPVAESSFLVTATQIGYALGIFLFVPLGDIVERRKLLSIVMLFTVIALICCASAPNMGLLLASLTFLGMVTVAGQIILPMVGDLASDSERGRLVGIITAGIITGILFSRLLSGLTAEFWNWRGIYYTAAIFNLILLFVLRHFVPCIYAHANNIKYWQLLVGVFTSVQRYKLMRGILLKQGMIFGIAFNLFWNAITFLLAGAPYVYDTLQIGLFSLSGLFGAMASSRIGRLQDAGLGRSGLTIFICLAICSMLAAVFLADQIIALVIIAVVFSCAVQGVGILCQAQLFNLTNCERSRLNTAFVVSNFIFCAVGSFLTFILWKLGGWQAVALSAALASAIALLIHLCESRWL